MGAVNIMSEMSCTALVRIFSRLFGSIQSVYSCATISFTASGNGSPVFKSRAIAPGIKSLKEVRLGAKFSGSGTPTK